MQRRKDDRRKDDSEFDAFARRVVRAYARRAANADPTVLATLAALQATLETSIADAVVTLHGRGFSWTEIAAQLGMKRQHAWRKWHEACEAAEVADAS